MHFTLRASIKVNSKAKILEKSLKRFGLLGSYFKLLNLLTNIGVVFMDSMRSLASYVME